MSVTIQTDSSGKSGFSVGDVVGWTGVDDDVRFDTTGRIVSFSTFGCPEVSFTKGEWEVVPEELFKVGNKMHGAPFCYGDIVTWTLEDNEIPEGTQGMIIGYKTKEVLVRFPSGRWYFPVPEIQQACSVAQAGNAHVQP